MPAFGSESFYDCIHRLIGLPKIGRIQKGASKDESFKILRAIRNQASHARHQRTQDLIRLQNFSRRHLSSGLFQFRFADPQSIENYFDRLKEFVLTRQSTYQTRSAIEGGSRASVPARLFIRQYEFAIDSIFSLLDLENALRLRSEPLSQPNLNEAWLKLYENIVEDLLQALSISYVKEYFDPKNLSTTDRWPSYRVTAIYKHLKRQEIRLIPFFSGLYDQGAIPTFKETAESVDPIVFFSRTFLRRNEETLFNLGLTSHSILQPLRDHFIDFSERIIDQQFLTQNYDPHHSQNFARLVFVDKSSVVFSSGQVRLKQMAIRNLLANLADALIRIDPEIDLIRLSKELSLHIKQFESQLDHAKNFQKVLKEVEVTLEQTPEDLSSAPLNTYPNELIGRNTSLFSDDELQFDTIAFSDSQNFGVAAEQSSKKLIRVESDWGEMRFSVIWADDKLHQKFKSPEKVTRADFNVVLSKLSAIADAELLLGTPDYVLSLHIILNRMKAIKRVDLSKYPHAADDLIRELKRVVETPSR